MKLRRFGEVPGQEASWEGICGCLGSPIPEEPWTWYRGFEQLTKGGCCVGGWSPVKGPGLMLVCAPSGLSVNLPAQGDPHRPSLKGSPLLLLSIALGQCRELKRTPAEQALCPFPSPSHGRQGQEVNARSFSTPGVH